MTYYSHAAMVIAVHPKFARDMQHVPTDIDQHTAVLTIWNPRDESWEMPIGKPEKEDSLEYTVWRTLNERCGVDAILGTQVYCAPHPSDRRQLVHVFATQGHAGEPSEREPGCPVLWKTPLELATQGAAHYRRFYLCLWTALGVEIANTECTQCAATRSSLAATTAELERARESLGGPENFNLERVRRATIHNAIKRAAGNKAEAARLLGIDRRTLYRYLELDAAR